MSLMMKVLVFLVFLVAITFNVVCADSPGKKSGEVTVIRMMPGSMHGIPAKEAMDPRSQARRAVFEAFRKENPDIRIDHAGGLELQGLGGNQEAGFLMSMAGNTAPDIFYSSFRQYYDFNTQGFCRPLDDLLEKDLEVKKNIHPRIIKILESFDGKIYALPWYQVAQALYFRKDHFIEAGLDPNRPPRTWKEFYEYGKKLTESAPGRKGFIFHGFPGGKAYLWANFAWQSGGELVVPTETKHWRSAVATSEAAKALDFYRKLMTEKWESSKTGKVVGPVAYSSVDSLRDIADGKVSMWFSYTNDVILATLTSDINPAFVGIARMPAGPAGHANEVNAGMWCINSSVKDPKKLEACWRFMKYFAGDRAAKINTDKFIELGFQNLVQPEYLKKFGYEDLAKKVDPEYVKASEDLFLTGHPEPYGPNCQHAYVVLNQALDRAELEKNTSSMDILKDISQEMDKTLLGYTPKETLLNQRAWAMGIFTVLLMIFATAFTIYVRRSLKRRRVAKEAHQIAGQNRKQTYLFVFLAILPAILSLCLWAYYPLFKGLQLAFQDYRLLGKSSWVGFDNFIEAFTKPLFYRSIMNSFLFVGISLLLGFIIPILLAVALNEIPKLKAFFRLVYYLPAMISPIVIALLWRQFYDATEIGLLNVILSPFIDFYNWLAMAFLGAASPPLEKALNWLGDPVLAMFAVVLPGVWAAAGPGSILYFAAMKNVPEERYEAADIDGASWLQKIWHISLPGLKPLIIINLLGVFVGGFKAMENIFVLTGGGPLNATHTMGLEVWTSAFMFLKFGYATAAAWVMGAILIGFTILQIRSLLKMRFKAAKL